MPRFFIDADHNITAYLDGEALPAGEARFASEKELAKLTATWPLDRLVELWNNFSGVVPFDDLKPVRKFTDRKTAVARIWRAIQRLAPAPTVAPSGEAGTQGAPKRTRSTQEATPRQGSKKAQVIELLGRPEGATLQQLVEATGWQAHSVRGFLSGTLVKKMGHKVTRRKRDDGGGAYFLTE
jgi:hypothetical protein